MNNFQNLMRAVLIRTLFWRIMIMFKKIFLMVLFLSVASICISDEIVYTESGRKVLLKDDGTWEYVKEDSNESEKFNFRKTRWGMNRKLVMGSENLKPIRFDKTSNQSQDSSNPRLVYKDSVIGDECLVEYVFVNNKLAVAGYMFTNKYSNENDYINQFKKVKEKLVGKYGKPKIDRVIWDNELYKSDPSRYGFAVSIGHVKYYAHWDLNETEITLALTGNNYDISHHLFYMSKSLKEAYHKSLDESNSDKF